MNLLELFNNKTRKDQNQETVEAVKARISKSQESVYKAVKEIGRPVNGLAVAQYMGVDSASVTNRLAELTRKGRLKIAYRKKGLDGLWRNFYVVNEEDK